MLQLLNYAGVFLFAATGALAASRKQLDIIGFIFLASLTGIGGGTARDVILDVPVFWVVEPIYILVCVAAAFIVFFAAPLLESRYIVLIWLDAVGLAAYCIMGAEKALSFQADPIIAIVMGTLTATMGGILRDILAHEPSVLMRREIYVSSALAGSTCFVTIESFALPYHIPAILGFIVCFVVRGGAILYGWTMPSYKPKRGRTEAELVHEGFIRADD